MRKACRASDAWLGENVFFYLTKWKLIFKITNHYLKHLSIITYWCGRRIQNNYTQIKCILTNPQTIMWSKRRRHFCLFQSLLETFPLSFLWFWQQIRCIRWCNSITLDIINMVNKSMYDLTEFIGKMNILITNKNCSIGHVLGHLIDFHWVIDHSVHISI